MELRKPPLKMEGGKILALVFGLILLAGGFFGGLGSDDREGKLAGAGAAGFGLLLTLGGVVALMRRRVPETLELADQGIVYKHGNSEKRIRFSDIRGLTLKHEQRLMNGSPVGTLRKLIINTDSGNFTLEDFWDREVSPDAITQTIDEVSAIADRTGMMFSGEGFSFDGQSVTTKRGTVTFSEVTAADVIDNHVLLWRDGAEPIVRAPVFSKNGVLLSMLVQKKLRDRRPEKGGDGMGRHLFQRKQPKSTLLVVGLVALIPLVTGLFLLTPGEDNVAIGAGCIVAGALALFGTLALSRSTTIFATSGIEQRGMFGTKSLAYSDITAITHTAIRHYYNGVYTGTQIVLTLESATGKMRIARHVREEDGALNDARDAIAERVAERLYRALGSEPEIAWMKGFFLGKSEARFFRSKLIGQGPEERRHYREDLRYRIDQGMFHLFLGDEQKAAFSGACSQRNFYPGFLLFLRLVGEANQ